MEVIKLNLNLLNSLPLKGAKVDGDDRTFPWKTHRFEMLFVYICDIVVYGIVIADVRNGDPCKILKHQSVSLLKTKIEIDETSAENGE